MRSDWIIFAKGQFIKARKLIKMERETGSKGWYLEQIREAHKEARWYLRQAGNPLPKK